MAGLTNLIIPGGNLSASEVAANFESLRSVVNNLPDESFEPGTVNTRHLINQANSALNLPFKSMYRAEFTEKSLPSNSYNEMVRVSATNLPLYEEDNIVFVFAELEVYNAKADSSPILVMQENDMYEVRLEFGQGTGAVPGSFGSFGNPTSRKITPGSTAVASEVGNVVLFGVARVLQSSTVFNARVTAGTFSYAGGAPGTNHEGKCKGAITALVISR
tara:strand:+ start:787 stop:1440 length:654 start_codon:yes stop_codon:yes gene_type:complete